jgi:hypothetical protein
MPLIVGCFALGMPRVMLVLVWLFSNLIGAAYSSLIWPILGLIFAPLTTLAYAYAHSQTGGNVSGFWLALVIVAVLLDFGLLRSGSRKRKKD